MGSLLAFAVLRGISPAAQSETEAPFTERVDVRVVEVELFVTNAKGERVRGLSREHFEVFEDGQPVAITNFEEIVGGSFGSSQDEVTRQPHARQQIADEVKPFHLVLYVDNVNIDAIHRRRILPQISAVLNGLARERGRVMLVSYDRSLNVRHPFTNDLDRIKSALTELLETSASGTSLAADRRQRLSGIVDASSPGRALHFARLAAVEIENDLRFSLDAQRRLIDQLAGLPGRKALLYVGDGLPMTSGRSLFHAVDEVHGGMRSLSAQMEFDNSARFRELAVHANSNDVMIYAVDAAGVRVSETLSVESRAVTPSAVDSVRTHNLQATIRYLADQTGGVAIVNQNRVETNLLAIGDDFFNYYSLAYEAPSSSSGRYHRIKVRPKDESLRVRHRQGYRAKTASTRMTDAVRSALRFGVDDNALSTELEFGDVNHRSDGLIMLPTTLSVPIDRLLLIPTGTMARAQLRLYVATVDGSGSMSAVQEIPLPIRIRSDELPRARKHRYDYTLSLLASPETVAVAIGLHDEIAGGSAVIRRGVPTSVAQRQHKGAKKHKESWSPIVPSSSPPSSQAETTDDRD